MLTPWPMDEMIDRGAFHEGGHVVSVGAQHLFLEAAPHLWTLYAIDLSYHITDKGRGLVPGPLEKTFGHIPKHPDGPVASLQNALSSKAQTRAQSVIDYTVLKAFQYRETEGPLCARIDDQSRVWLTKNARKGIFSSPDPADLMLANSEQDFFQGTRFQDDSGHVFSTWSTEHGASHHARMEMMQHLQHQAPDLWARYLGA